MGMGLNSIELIDIYPATKMFKFHNKVISCFNIDVLLQITKTPPISLVIQG